MMGAHVSGVTHCDDEGIVAASVMAGWLYLAAAPTFAIMALLTVVFDSGLPNALWRDGRISFIRDYRYARYIVSDAALMLAADGEPADDGS